ncbi:unnamed protein product [Didymodactylos carnosus]|uniref:EF-hand domain-containing protein n=1 Tax=Didymodactylos carnosus TaxID=1234261 RepID=A0A815W8V7_9BILA|nr:unnamed protein product [Didymodactylos carnosus]CAF1544774.1 unnamed protein product [Didymodactylos carnosus]CAF4192968.1 unnamed protein product [Didymodactylos carnosus]CAF4405394.1 unnamed protein product [Didymodactylos carnosus]
MADASDRRASFEKGDLSYSVEEKIFKNNGRIEEVVYEYEETRQQSVQKGFQDKQEDRKRVLKAAITRQQYEDLAKKIHKTLSFDDFLYVLRPFMMGSYSNDEINQAFKLLDTDNSGEIDIDELAAFLPIINPQVTKDTLTKYIWHVDENSDQKLSINEFNDLLSRGIGRDIVCGHVN